MNKITIFGCCCAAAALFELSGAEVNFKTLLNGTIAPVSEADGALRFSAGENDAAAAQIPGSFDFSRGGKITLEFSVDPVQSNRFPRLLDGGMVSIQGEVPAPGQACSRVKFTITSKDAKQFTNVFAKPTPTPGNWHRFAAWIDAEAGTASVQLDDGEVVTLPLAVSVDILKDIKFTLGATGLKGSTRGFSGAIRNLDISTGPTVDLDPASAAANAAIDLSKAELAPGAAYADGALSFKATADTATPARLPGSFDFSRGGKIELEFLDGGEQTNPFPRLLEGGGLSLHFESTPGHADKTMKFLLTGDDAQRYHQVLVPVRHRPGVWRKATATYSPGAGEITLQVDDEQLATVPCDIAPAKADKISFVLGARAFKNNDNRGFSGSIRNLSVTTPYGPAGTPGAAKRQIEAPTVNGEPVEHITISAVKNRHSAFPGVTRMPNGDLAVVFREGEAHVCPYGRICLVLSKDGGKNWSAPIAVADTASDERDPSIQTLPDGRVLISHGGWNSWMYYENTAKNFPGESAYINQAGPEKFGGSRYIFSTDNGETWSRPIKVKGFAPHGPAYVNGKFYQPSLGSDNGKRQVNMFIGNSDATEWEGPFLVGESELGLVSVVPVFEEPHTVALADGTLVTAIRVPSDGYMRISRSTDGGKSWSEPVKTPVRGFPQHLLQLRDGRLLATYGYRYYPYGVRACVSRDGGLTWDIDKEYVIQNNGINTDLGYPVSIELDDGRVFSVYYNITKERPTCFVEGAFWRP